MKYKVFRSFGRVDKDVKKHELVAIEDGKDIDAVTDRLIKVVGDDLLGLEKYARGFKSEVYAPERIDNNIRRVARYAYFMNAVAVSPSYVELNESIEYGIMECAE